MTRRDNTVRLSDRLMELAAMVSPGSTVVDVGCDHGFLDIYLVQTEKVEHAIAMDVRKGPLNAAREHVREWKLEERIETRLSDGLKMFQPGEASTLVCAGMGGPLMQRILTDFPEKTASFQEMILQPQSELREFREFLAVNGYRIVEERILLEEGKYYFPMKVRKASESERREDPENRELFYRFGEGLLLAGDLTLKKYLTEQERINQTIVDSLKIQEDAEGLEEDGRERRLHRLDQVEGELELIRKALVMLEHEVKQEIRK